MQKFILLVLVLLGIGFVFTYSFNTETEAHPAEIKQERETTEYVTPTTAEQTEAVAVVSKSVFVPYWSVSNLEEVAEYDTAIYFGISVTEDGVNRSDKGFAQLSTFVRGTSNDTKLLTIRMLDTDTNLEILEHVESQQAILEDISNVAKEYSFDGIVLDLELSVIPFSDVKESINVFVKNVSTELASEDLDFHVALYGDTYYRSRPYDVDTIGTYADQILIMAYDFHKSRGEPGPNFPFTGQKTYGYDFQQMINDFSKDVPPEKLSVIFGMYGYDWILGKEGKPLKSATAFSLADGKAGFVSNCSYSSCQTERDLETHEMKVTYVDEDGYDHTAWFEDEESVDIKIEYLMEQGIGNISYWTWGYW